MRVYRQYGRYQDNGEIYATRHPLADGKSFLINKSFTTTREVFFDYVSLLTCRNNTWILESSTAFFLTWIIIRTSMFSTGDQEHPMRWSDLDETTQNYIVEIAALEKIGLILPEQSYRYRHSRDWLKQRRRRHARQSPNAKREKNTKSGSNCEPRKKTNATE